MNLPTPNLPTPNRPTPWPSTYPKGIC